MKPKINLQTLPPPLFFPGDALQQSLCDLALELHRNTQAPFEMIVSSILGAISVTCQNAVDVRVPVIDSVSPVSLCITVLAKSGERKTTVDRLTMKPLRDFEAKQAELVKPKLIQYQADWTAWNIQRKAILKTIEKALKISMPTEQTTGDFDD